MIVYSNLCICDGQLLYSLNFDANAALSMPTKKPIKVTAPQARGEAFTRAVLDAALMGLSEVGYERLSIPQVAQLADVNKTSIYRRWPSKADLVRDALAIAMNHTENAPNTGALRTDLIELAKSTASLMQSPIGSALVRIMLAEGGNPEVTALARAAYGEAGKQAPWKVIQHAMERGELSQQADASLMLFTMAGAVMHRVFVERTAAHEAFLTQVVDMVLFGAVVNQ